MNRIIECFFTLRTYLIIIIRKIRIFLLCKSEINADYLYSSLKNAYLLINKKVILLYKITAN